jgi:hypothetical protein
LNPCLSPARLYGQYGSVPPEVSEIKWNYRKKLTGFKIFTDTETHLLFR